jgi:hypothetical protein
MRSARWVDSTGSDYRADGGDKVHAAIRGKDLRSRRRLHFMGFPRPQGTAGQEGLNASVAEQERRMVGSAPRAVHAVPERAPAAAAFFTSWSWKKIICHSYVTTSWRMI